MNKKHQKLVIKEKINRNLFFDNIFIESIKTVDFLYNLNISVEHHLFLHYHTLTYNIPKKI